MKKILLLIIILISFGCSNKFYLNESYYKKAEIIKIDQDEYNRLVNSEETFIIFISALLCPAVTDFRDIINEFTINNNLTIYEINFENIKETNLDKKVKYYPSVAIIKKGKVVRYLDADSKKDKECYESISGLEECLGKYIYLNNNA